MRVSTLKDLREHAGLTQKELGEKLGLTQAGVSRVELMHNMRISTLRAFVEACGGTLTLTVRLNGVSHNLKIGKDG